MSGGLKLLLRPKDIIIIIAPFFKSHRPKDSIGGVEGLIVNESMLRLRSAGPIRQSLSKMTTVLDGVFLRDNKKDLKKLRSFLLSKA